jgi:hypothetical protein
MDATIINRASGPHGLTVCLTREACPVPSSDPPYLSNPSRSCFLAYLHQNPGS